MQPFRAEAGGVLVFVRLTPRVAGDTARLVAALEAKLSAPVHLHPKRR